MDADDEIPEGFNNTSTSKPISILIGDKSGKELPCVHSFSINSMTADVDFYWYQIIVETDDSES